MIRTYQQTLKQRLTRRRFLAGAAGAAVGAGAASLACTSGRKEIDFVSAETPDPNEMPTPGGTLRIRQENPLPSLSPFGLTSLISSGLFGFTTYDHLWYVPLDTGEIVPFLAEDGGIEQVDPEGLQVNIRIRETYYHDKPPVNGRQVLASDVPPSWARFRDDPFGLGRQWLREIMESVEAPDDRTVVIKQKRPFAWMFGTSHAGSAFSSSVLPVEVLDDDEFLARDVIGSGRYFLESHRNGENIKLRAHPRWRVPGEPYLGGIDFVLITEDAAAQAQFRAGQLDVLGTLGGALNNKIEAERLKSELGDQITATGDLSAAYSCLMLKMQPPFDDERVRHGINLAIDRLELIRLVELDPEGGVPAGIVPPAQERYALSQDELSQEYHRHDPNEARQLLERASFPFDQEFGLKFPSGEETQKRAQVLKEQLGRAGVKVRLESQDLLTVWLPRTLNQGEFDMTLFTHLSYEDPSLPLAFYSNNSPIGPQDPQRGRNNMGFFDDEITAAARAAEVELDEGARIEKVKEAQRLIIRKWGPMLNLYSGVSFGARWNWLKGVVTGRGSYGLFNGRLWIDEAMRRS